MKILDENEWDQGTDSLPPGHKESNSDTDKARERNRQALRSALATAITSAGVQAVPEKAVDYLKWSIMDEPSLDEIASFCKHKTMRPIITSLTPNLPN